MRHRKTLIMAGAIGLVALASGLLALIRIGPAQAVRTTAVPAAITVDPDVGETFAPPPADAAPALTAAQAYSQWQQQVGVADAGVPADATVQLGLLTLPVGPDCGAECSSLTIKDGIAYTALNELVYGYATPCSPEATSSAPGPCLDWTFLDASTGTEIDKAVHMSSGSHRPS